jgi:hypothetical protein
MTPKKFDTGRRFVPSGRHFDAGATKSDSQEGREVKAQLARIIRAATILSDALDDNDDLPQWVHYKIATAADRLIMAADYILLKIAKHKKGQK